MVKKEECLNIGNSQVVYQIRYATSVTLDATNSTKFEMVGSRKIVRAGTVLDATASLLAPGQAKVTALITPVTKKGILVNDVDITDGDNIGTALVDGIVVAERLTNFTVTDYEDVLGNKLITAVSAER